MRPINASVIGSPFLSKSTLTPFSYIQSGSNRLSPTSRKAQIAANPSLAVAIVRAMADKNVRLSPEYPEADLKHIVRGSARVGLKPVPPKTSISLRVDQDVLGWFKAQGDGYQTRINAVLRAFRDASE